jgi:hypothetical protein
MSKFNEAGKQGAHETRERRPPGRPRKLQPGEVDPRARLEAAEPREESQGRRPGRPRRSEAGATTKGSIIRLGYRLTKTINLQDVSIVYIARTMAVTPASIHYYIKSRDHLTSGIMNLFFRDMVRKLPVPTGLWESDLIQAAWAMYRHFVAYPGVAAYSLLNNRFRIFQLTEDNAEDYGIQFLEHFTALVMRSGCVADRAGVYSHLLRDFIVSAAYAAVSHRYPAEHKSILESKVSALEPGRFPAIHATIGSQLKLDAEVAFREGCHLFVVGLKEHHMQRAALGAEPAPSRLEAAGRKGRG